MSLLRNRIVETRTGSRVAILEGGAGGPALFLVGGLSPSGFAQSSMRPLLDDVAGGRARVVLMDIAGSGSSTGSPGFTMDTWLEDLEQVFEQRVGAPAIATGASIGAWLMLLAHRRHPEWFTAMCALAPAIDWDQHYVGPGLRDGRLSVAQGGTVVNPESTLAASRELLVSMAAHHVSRTPFALAAPLHVIAGLRDEISPAAATQRFIQLAHGAPCTGEFLTEADHRLAKLEGPVATQRYSAWLGRQLAGATTAGATREPADPRSAR